MRVSDLINVPPGFWHASSIGAVGGFDLIIVPAAILTALWWRKRVLRLSEALENFRCDRDWLESQIKQKNAARKRAVTALAAEKTDRKIVEESLSNVRVVLRTIIDALPDPVYIKDPRGRYLLNNKAHLRFVGAGRPEEVFGKTSCELVAPEMARQSCRDDWRVTTLGESVIGAIELTEDHSGNARWHSATKIPLRDCRGSVVGMLGIERDITRRHLAEESLRESESKFRSVSILRSILDSMGDGVVVADEKGDFVLCNPAAEALLGRSSASMVGQQWANLYVPLLQDKVTVIEPKDRPLARAIRGEAVAAAEVFLRPKPDSTGVWLSVTARPIRSEDGLSSGGVLVLHDVTERKCVEAQLSEAKEAAEAASRSKSEFLANMSHEIRTPMTAILGFADRMLAPNQGLSDLQNWVTIIRRNGQHLLNLINDILDISKIEAGQMTTEKIACDLPQLLSDLRSLMRPRAAEKGLDFDLSFNGAIPKTVMTDPVRMKQILVNLTGNAIKFTPGGRIGLCVSCDATAPSLVLKFDVSDTGIGMSDQQVSKLFQPFTQADESTTRRFGGTGLGLTISRQLANLLGGDVVVKSCLGVGSTFTATLDGGPAVKVEMVQGMTEEALPQEPGMIASKDVRVTGRILLAEDGRDNQRLLTEILRSAGAEVTVAENGRIAVDLAKSAAFDLILMDMQMPELDGYGATAELRDAGCKFPIIALTAHAMAEDREKCLASGCDGYLTKPIESDKFLSTIARFLPAMQIGEIAPVPQLPRKEFMMQLSESGRIKSDYANVASLKAIIREFVADLPTRVREIQTQFSMQQMDLVKRSAHQLRGAGGGYGFAEMTELAAQVEQAVKDGQPQPEVSKLIDQLISYIQRIEGYEADGEHLSAPARLAA